MNNVILGKGSYGVVYEGLMQQQDGSYKEIAIKQIDKSMLIKQNQQNGDYNKMIMNVKREADTQKKLANENILRLYDVQESKNNIYFCLELSKEGNLQDYLTKNRPYLQESDAINFFKQIVNAFTTLEQYKIAHRDLKPANILIIDNIIKISDFGFARFIEDGQSEFTNVGSPMYMSLQALTTSKYNPFKTDVWAAGIMFYQMLYGIQSFPWQAQTIVQLVDRIQNQELKFPENPQRSQLVKDLIKNLLNVNEEQRYSWKQISEHPLIAQQQTIQVIQNDQNQFNQFNNQNSNNNQIDIENNVEIHQQQNSLVQENNIISILESKNINQVKNLTEFVVNKATIYSYIRTQYQLAIQKNDLQQIQLQISYTIILIMIYKEFNLLDKFKCGNAYQQMIQFRQNINQQELNKYLCSGHFITLMGKINQQYIQIQEHRDNEQQKLMQQIKNYGESNINQNNMDQILQKCLENVKQKLPEIIQYSKDKNKLSILQLMIYLHLLYQNEYILNQFNSIDELTETIQSYNFMDAQELIDVIKYKWNII